VNSGKLLTSNVEDNPEPILPTKVRRCRDYPAREYTTSYW